MSSPDKAPGEVLCLVCRKRPVVAAFQPFCSKRCADIDLGRWLGGSYVVPGEDGGAADLQKPSQDEE